MFWGLILKSNKRYTQNLEKSFHLAQASLDTTTANTGDVQVWYSNEEDTFLLCTLQKNGVIQQSLNLNFTVGDKVTFFSKGSGVVHLTGSLLPEGFDDDFDSDDDEDAPELEENEPALAKKEGKKETPTPVKADKKDEDDDMDEDGLGDDLDSADDDSDDDDVEEDDDDDEEEDDDSDDDSEVEVEQPKKKQKLDKKAVQNGLGNGKKDSKEAPKAKKDNATSTQQNKQAKANKLVLQGGVVAVDRQAGNGKVAKAGKKVQVYYEGRLKDTNKTFDSSKQGPGFKFTLGRGEVIKGWDIGVAGMKVGGKRTLTIPANLAYGAKGYPPTIPPNSQLVFDIELKNVF